MREHNRILQREAAARRDNEVAAIAARICHCRFDKVDPGLPGSDGHHAGITDLKSRKIEVEPNARRPLIKFLRERVNSHADVLSQIVILLIPAILPALTLGFIIVEIVFEIQHHHRRFTRGIAVVIKIRAL